MNTTSSVTFNELVQAFGALFVFGVVIASSGLLSLNRMQGAYVTLPATATKRIRR